MAKKERSFFGKIMGNSASEEDARVPVSVHETEQEYAEPETLEEELMEVDVEETEDIEDSEPVPAQEAVPPVKEAKPAGNEEWLSDYEGQLNIDMYQTKDNVIIKSTIAGVRPEDMDITVANDMLTIKGARRREETVAEDDYFYQECYWGNFSRSVIIPVDIDSEHIEADLKDGILTVVVPKAAKAKTKKIKVKGL